MEAKKVRCAVYTRKSTEEGLDKEFNTLEAQRESGENYIKSQSHEGWVVNPEHYDDGGFSGGNMNRPALQRLFSDIKDGKVDMIVVYKIDRLTRSLLDFAKMVELFNKYNVSFVSVTQHFNTCDSMGKLTLNILLSFAQFERELSSERIRDKFAASRKKGMWMGGSVPLGYDLKDKKLIINKKEAEIVKFIFEDYLVSFSEQKTACDVNALGYEPKKRFCKDGHLRGKGTFNKNMISSILNNPTYLGKCPHKGELYEGQHKAIITQDLWDKVKAAKKKNSEHRFLEPRSVKNTLLKGLVECECCGAMVPTRTKQRNKYYEYYTSLKAVREGYDKCQVGSIPAAELDMFVLEKVQAIFKCPEIIQELAKQIKPLRPDIGEKEIFDIVQNMDKVFRYFSPATLQSVIRQVVERVLIGTDYIKIKFSSFGIKCVNEDQKRKENGYNSKALEFCYNVSLRRKRGRIQILQPGIPLSSFKDQKLINALALAFKWKELMEEKHLNIKELAKRENFNRSYMARLLRLTLLAPTIINSIIDGKQPRNLKIENFTREEIPHLWSDQLKKYGFI